MGFMKSFFGKPRSRFSVGDILYNEKSRKTLLLKKKFTYAISNILVHQWNVLVGAHQLF